MSWSTFKEIGKLREAAQESVGKPKLVIDGGLYYRFPDGMLIDAFHLKDRSTKAITGWLNVLWIAHIWGRTDDKRQICEQVGNGIGCLQSNQG